jgi:arabinan endo-1,5-alpha-L-arabinosidase
MMTGRLAALCGGTLLVACVVAVAAAQTQGPPKGLVLYFSFDQKDADGKAIDASEFKNRAKVEGPTPTSTGKAGGGVEFSAGTNVITIAPSDSLKLEQATFAAWLKTSKTDATWRRIFDQGRPNGLAMAIGGEMKDAPNADTRGKLAFSLDGKTAALSDAPLADGAWHHAAGTFDGEELRLYIDGVLQKRVVAATGPVLRPGDAPLTIGMRPGPGRTGASFEGSLDEIMIFNRALSPDEIKAMVGVVSQATAKPKFTKGQVLGRIRQLKSLHDEGLLTDEFYKAKLAECEAALP